MTTDNTTYLWINLLNKLHEHPLYLEYDLFRLSKNFIMFQVTHGFDYDYICLEWLLSADLTSIFTVEFNTFYYLICFASEDDAAHFKLAWEDGDHVARVYY